MRLSLQQRIAKAKPLRKNLRKRKKSQGGGGGGGQSDHLNILTSGPRGATSGAIPSPAPPSSPILVRSVMLYIILPGENYNKNTTLDPSPRGQSHIRGWASRR